MKCYYLYQDASSHTGASNLSWPHLQMNESSQNLLHVMRIQCYPGAAGRLPTEPSAAQSLDPFDGNKNMHLLSFIIVGELLYGIYDIY